MAKIFISYRRADSAYVAGLIFERVAIRFGREAVFMDIDAIPYGEDFREHIENAVQQCDVVLVVIGDNWLTSRYADGPNEGKRRLDDPRDFVRLEIEAALARNIPVIPVLADHAVMPGNEELPASLQPLCFRNAAELRAGRDFQVHADRLIKALQDVLARADKIGEEEASETTQTPAAPAVASSAETPSAALLYEPSSGTLTPSVEESLESRAPAEETEDTAWSREATPSVFLVPVPRIVFLYPTFVTAVIVGIFVMIHPEGETHEKPDTSAIAGSLLFLLAFSVNLVVLAFDFPKVRSLKLFFISLVSLLVVCWVFLTFYPEYMPSFVNFLAAIQPIANSTYYFIFAGVLGLIFISVWFSVRFDYWSIDAHQLLHHSGIFSDLERYPVEGLKIEKEIPCIFKYLLFRSGNLVIYPRHALRPIILENILYLPKKEKRLLQSFGLKVE